MAHGPQAVDGDRGARNGRPTAATSSPVAVGQARRGGPTLFNTSGWAGSAAQWRSATRVVIEGRHVVSHVLGSTGEMRRAAAKRAAGGLGACCTRLSNCTQSHPTSPIPLMCVQVLVYVGSCWAGRTTFTACPAAMPRDLRACLAMMPHPSGCTPTCQNRCSAVVDAAAVDAGPHITCCTLLPTTACCR